MMIKGRENNKSLVKKQQSSDLLVCFPTRAHLALMPKPICSPNRPNLKKLTARAASSSSAGGSSGSPLIWAKDNHIRGGGPEMSEPTSPKVTCAGQIKVRPRSSRDCRNWQSVMEEIEKIHNSSKHNNNNSKKKTSLVETFGFKKDVMNFLTCLRNVRFDFRCFGSFHGNDLSSEDEDEDADEDNVYEEEDSFKEIIDDIDEKGSNGINDNDNNNSNNNSAVFSKWYMVLQENECNVDDKVVEHKMRNDDFVPIVPPKNALLLMRCRSAPAKSWLEEKEYDDNNDNNSKEENEEEKNVVQDEKEEEMDKKKRETLAIVMKYDSDFYKLSNDVAQETWVVGEIKDPFARSRSWRR